MLFVPAGNERYLDSALRGDADVIQIDLEDAIAPDRKDEAREHAVRDVEKIAASGRAAVVRVNVDPDLLARDLDAVVSEHLSALTIPKVDSAATLALVDERLALLEEERGLSYGEIRLVAQIESARGVLNARSIAMTTPRLAAMGIGMEDLVAEVGGRVNEDALYFPNMQVLYASREAGVTPIGYLGSITVYDDEDRFRAWVARAAALGFEGGFCIHPNQVSILNELFSPEESGIGDIKALIEAFEIHRAEGKGAFAHKGRMVDKPVVDRAKRTLNRWKKLSG